MMNDGVTTIQVVLYLNSNSTRVKRILLFHIVEE